MKGLRIIILVFLLLFGVAGCAFVEALQQTSPGYENKKADRELLRSLRKP